MKYMLLTQFSAENAGFPDLSTWIPRAARNYRAAASRTTSTPEYRYLSIRAARLGTGAATGDGSA